MRIKNPYCALNRELQGDEVWRNNLTLLHSACESGSLSLVKYLIEDKIDFSYRDDISMTPLHYAAFCGHRPVSLVRLLVENYLCDPDVRSNDFSRHGSGRGPHRHHLLPANH